MFLGLCKHFYAEAVNIHLSDDEIKYTKLRLSKDKDYKYDRRDPEINRLRICGNNLIK